MSLNYWAGRDAGHFDIYARDGDAHVARRDFTQTRKMMLR